MSFSTAYVPRLSIYLQLEIWARQNCIDLLLVPPMTDAASLFIYKRELSLYRFPGSPSPSEVGGGGRGAVLAPRGGAL